MQSTTSTNSKYAYTLTQVLWPISRSLAAMLAWLLVLSNSPFVNSPLPDHYKQRS